MSERLPPDVESLLEAERQAPDPAAERKARVGRRLEVTLGLAAAVTVSTGAAAAAAKMAPAVGKSIALKLAMAAVGTSLVVGGGIYVALRYHSPTPAPIVVPQESTRRVTQALAPPRTLPPTILVPTVAPIAAAKNRHEKPDELALEQAYLEEARAALVGGAPERALQLLSLHERRFSAGQLGDARDSLRISALMAAGHVEAARTRAADFRRRYPHSLFQPAVDASLDPRR